MKKSTTVLISNVSDDSKKKSGLQSFLKELKAHNVHVVVCNFAKEDSALGTSNWLSFHKNGISAVYPLLSKNARSSRSEMVFEELEKEGVSIASVVDYTAAEEEEFYLEGLRSMVLDPANEIAYASISNHTDEDLFVEFCEDFEYTPMVFRSTYKNGMTISYTSDILFVGDFFVMVASACIPDKKERKLVLNQLKKTGKELIFINESQVSQGITSVVEVKNEKGKTLFFMSESVCDCFQDAQLRILEKYGAIVMVRELPMSFSHLRNFTNLIEM